MYILLEFELYLRKSKEFNNKQMKVQIKRALKSYFWHQKSNKKGEMLCMKSSSTSHMAHELDPKKMDTLLQQVSKTWYRFLVTSRCLYFLEKFDELSRSVVFGRNWGILQTRMDRRNEFENEFKVLSNSEMNVTTR